MTFQFSWLVVSGATLGVLMVCLAILRRVELPKTTLWLFVLAAALLAVSMAQPRWHRPREGVVDVLVDLSPSTRTADYRQRRQLDTRIAELLGSTKYRLVFFADGIATPDANRPALADVPCEKTSMPPSDADAVLLFSDARFTPPEAGPPMYVVIDPGLEQPADAAVTRLEIRGSEAVASLQNSGPGRTLTIIGANDPNPSVVPAGAYAIDRSLRADAASVSAQLSAGDAWPENDALDIYLPSPVMAQRWWVGSAVPGGDWKLFAPEDLPVDGRAYLGPEVIVLDNISAKQIDEVRQQHLRQYVAELGGGIVICGGNHAFGAGAYLGSILENLSPLASAPPRPTMRWSLLVDGSGSMASQEASGTRWALAITAMADLLPHLPPDDLADVGSFAQTLTWWSSGKTVRQTLQQMLPPGDVYPHGPTNLEPALLEIAGQADVTIPRQLLLISDGDVQIDRPAALIETLRRKGIHLQVLAIGQGSGLAILRDVAAATGGAVVQRIDPREWSNGARELLGSAMPSNFEHTSVAIQFENELAYLTPRTIGAWNRAWLKNGASALAGANAEGMRVPLAAKWNVGEGRVAAAAFAATGGEIDSLEKLIARPPRDPRFSVAWKAGATLSVSVDAIDGKKYLNGQAVSLRLLSNSSPGDDRQRAVRQVEPGRYALELPAPRAAAFAEAIANGEVIDRIAVAGRYAPEFDAIGNDHATMKTIADRTGGDVIFPATKHPIDFHWPRHDVLLSSWFAVLAAVCMAVGLIRWRLR